MNVHVLQHVAFEGLGSIREWLDARGAQTSVRFFENTRLPALDTVDMLIAMGGPMSVNDETELPWLRSEKQFVRDAVARDIPVLGVCLGAQLIASALGSRVFRNPVKRSAGFPFKRFQSPSPRFAFHQSAWSSTGMARASTFPTAPYAWSRVLPARIKRFS
jgi:GMP synthase-like glutamine amidotransferase